MMKRISLCPRRVVLVAFRGGDDEHPTRPQYPAYLTEERILLLNMLDGFKADDSIDGLVSKWKRIAPSRAKRDRARAVASGRMLDDLPIDIDADDATSHLPKQVAAVTLTTGNIQHIL